MIAMLWKVEKQAVRGCRWEIARKQHRTCYSAKFNQPARVSVRFKNKFLVLIAFALPPRGKVGCGGPGSPLSSPEARLSRRESELWKLVLICCLANCNLLKELPVPPSSNLMIVGCVVLMVR